MWVRLKRVARSKPIQFLGSFICIALLVTFVDVRDALQRIGNARPEYLAAAGGVAVLDRIVMVSKWIPLLKPIVPDVSIPRAVRAYLGSGLGLYLLPASIGADILRATALGVGREKVTEVSVSIVAERTLGLAGMGAVCLGSLALALRTDVDLTLLLPWALTAVVVGFGVILAPMSDWLRSLLRSIATRFSSDSAIKQLVRVSRAFDSYRGRLPMLTAVGVASAIEQLVPVFVMWFISLSLGLQLPLHILFIVMPLSLFISRLPISFGGIGVTEGAMVYLLGLFGVGLSDALALAVVGRLLDIVVVAVPGALLWHELVPDQVEESSASK